MKMLHEMAGKYLGANAVILVGLLLLNVFAWAGGGVDLGAAMVVVRPGELPNAEKAATAVLVEEVEKRSGIRLETSTNWPVGRAVIAITSQPEARAWGRDVPVRKGDNLPERRAEGYRLLVDTANPSCPAVWIIGADARGALYGVGALLRNLDRAKGSVRVSSSLDIATAPASPIRGHQLGYRTAANSWDAWDVAQFDQYIRELAFFGVNSVENIPFQDERVSPVMKVPRREMNRAMSAICERYGKTHFIIGNADTRVLTFGTKDQIRAEVERCMHAGKRCPGYFLCCSGHLAANVPVENALYYNDMYMRLRNR